MENLQMGVPFFWVVAAFFVGRGYEKNKWRGALRSFLYVIGFAIILSILVFIFSLAYWFLNN